MQEGVSSTGRLVGIEGVRAIAAISVVLYHVHLYAAPDGQYVDLGFLTKLVENMRSGVTLFFVLSGFLLYRVFVAAALRGQSMPSVREYLRNRALRILPAYWAVLVAVVIVFQRELLERPLQLVANAALAQNYFPAYVTGGTDGLGIVPAWSIVVEVSFYVVLPLLGYVAVSRANSGRVAVVSALLPVAAMFLIGGAAKVIARSMEQSSAQTVWNASLLSHADWFAAGMAVAVVRVLHEDGRLTMSRRWIALAAGLAGLVAALTAKLYYAGEVTALEQQTANAVFFALVLALVVLAAPSSPVVRFLSLKPVYLVGLASYSLFLVHDPLLRGFREWGITFAGPGGYALNVAVVGGTALVLAALSYRYVERPALARKRTWHVGTQSGLGSDAPAGAGEKPEHHVPLSDALERVVARARQDGNGVQISCEPRAAAWVVRPGLFEAVVAPIVDNAITYGRPPITVTAEVTPTGLSVAVEDTGRGVEPEFRPLLFEPKARSTPSAEESPGVGLGLSRARSAARMEGGDIRYEPREERGARFVAVFPSGAGSPRSALEPGGRASEAREAQASGVPSPLAPTRRLLGRLREAMRRRRVTKPASSRS